MAQARRYSAILNRENMVYLSKIYTKTGDEGQTGLGNGSRVPKDNPRVAAYGSIDELNAVLGLLLACAPDLEPGTSALLRGVQNDLFDVGADLCVPSAADEKPGQVLRIQPEQAARLETDIDRWNLSLKPLKSFILPGGSAAAAWCHLARTVCRRAERDVVTLMRTEAINPHVLIYVNRLSDWLFVLARMSNEQGRNDVLWEPGKSTPLS
jgi:cob(I)alamin adenosyltransferase